MDCQIMSTGSSSTLNHTLQTTFNDTSAENRELHVGTNHLNSSFSCDDPELGSDIGQIESNLHKAQSKLDASDQSTYGSIICEVRTPETPMTMSEAGVSLVYPNTSGNGSSVGNSNKTLELPTSEFYYTLADAVATSTPKPHHIDNSSGDDALDLCGEQNDDLANRSLSVTEEMSECCSNIEQKYSQSQTSLQPSNSQTGKYTCMINSTQPEQRPSVAEYLLPNWSEFYQSPAVTTCSPHLVTALTEVPMDCHAKFDPLCPASQKNTGRFKYSEDVVKILEQSFLNNPYPNRALKEQLGGLTGVGHDRIKTWFQNKRNKERKRGNQSMRCRNVPSKPPYSVYSSVSNQMYYGNHTRQRSPSTMTVPVQVRPQTHTWGTAGYMGNPLKHMQKQTTPVNAIYHPYTSFSKCASEFSISNMDRQQQLSDATINNSVSPQAQHTIKQLHQEFYGKTRIDHAAQQLSRLGCDTAYVDTTGCTISAVTHQHIHDNETQDSGTFQPEAHSPMSAGSADWDPSKSVYPDKGYGSENRLLSSDELTPAAYQSPCKTDIRVGDVKLATHSVADQCLIKVCAGVKVNASVEVLPQVSSILPVSNENKFSEEGQGHDVSSVGQGLAEYEFEAASPMEETSSDDESPGRSKTSQNMSKISASGDPPLMRYQAISNALPPYSHCSPLMSDSSLVYSHWTSPITHSSVSLGYYDSQPLGILNNYGHDSGYSAPPPKYWQRNEPGSLHFNSQHDGTCQKNVCILPTTRVNAHINASAIDCSQAVPSQNQMAQGVTHTYSQSDLNLKQAGSTSHTGNYVNLVSHLPLPDQGVPTYLSGSEACPKGKTIHWWP